MQTQTIKTFQHVPGESAAAVARSGSDQSRIRSIAFWVTTFIIVFELVAGSVWNLKLIEWNVVQLRHLGYPTYLAYILGAWHVGAAIAIAAPRLPRLKEWAYAGSFFLWSGAVMSHLFTGDGPELWLVPLFFASCDIASWTLRPADRRLPETRFTGLRTWEARPRAWAVPIGLLVVLYAVSFLSLPAVEVALHKRAVKLGWIAR